MNLSVLCFLLILSSCNNSNDTVVEGGSGDNTPGNGQSGSGNFTFIGGAPSAQADARGIAKDSFGNFYVVGITHDNLTGAGLYGQLQYGIFDCFLIKFNSSGTLQWARQIGVAGSSAYGLSVVIDANDNIYITGWTDGNLDGLTKNGTQDAFILKYTTGGVKIWSKLLGVSSAITNGNDISVDSNGNIYVTGMTQGNLNGANLNGNADAFLAKYNTSGSLLWIRLLGVTSRTTFGRGIAIDSSDNIFITGQTDGNLESQSGSGATDVFLTKFDVNGNKIWTRLSGSGFGQTIGWGVKVDNSGNPYIVGETEGNLNGQSHVGDPNVSNAFIIKYNSSGSRLWTRLHGNNFNTAAETRADDVAIDSNGYPHLLWWGDYDGDYNMDTMMEKYDPSGNLIWSKETASSSTGQHVIGFACIFDKNDDVFVIGQSSATLDGIPPIGSTDFFLSSRFNY